MVWDDDDDEIFFGTISYIWMMMMMMMMMTNGCYDVPLPKETCRGGSCGAGREARQTGLCQGGGEVGTMISVTFQVVGIRIGISV